VSKTAIKVRPASVGLATPVFGCNSETGKIALGIIDALARAKVPAGVIGVPEPTGYSIPPAAPENFDAVVSLAAPWTWRYDPAKRLLGIVNEPVDTAPASWHDPLRFADRIFAPSKWAANVIGSKAQLLPFGIDSAFRYEPKPERPKFRVLFVAEDASDSRKGLGQAVDGFKTAFGNRDDVELVIRSLVRGNLEKDDVRLRFAFGNMTPAELAKLYRSADVLIYSSQSEAFGFEALEAMACGTPAIHSGKTGMADFANLGLIAMSREVRGATGGTWHEIHSGEIAELLQFADTEPEALAIKAAEDAAAVSKRFRWSLEPLIRSL
jgi:glycosyltransferase involved in cell wall biosynthesis